MLNRFWLAREILNNQAPMTSAMAKFFQKLDLAIKVNVDEDIVKQAIKFDFKEQNIVEVSTWNPILSTLTWIEGVMPSTHAALFGDTHVMQLASEPNTSFDVPFGFLVEMNLDLKDYKFHFVNKPIQIMVNPLMGNLVFKSAYPFELSWDTTRSKFFEEDYWNMDIAREIMPVAENSILGAASLFFGILAVIGGFELTNWKSLSIVRN